MLKVFPCDADVPEGSALADTVDGDPASIHLADYLTQVTTANPASFSKLKPADYPAGKAILELAPAQRFQVLVASAEQLLADCFADPVKDAALRNLIKRIVQKPLPFDDRLSQKLFRTIEKDLLAVAVLPLNGIIACVKKHAKREGLTPSLREGLKRLAQKLTDDEPDAQLRKVGRVVCDILDDAAEPSDGSPVLRVMGGVSIDADTNGLPREVEALRTGEAWTNSLIDFATSLDHENATLALRDLVIHWHKATQSKPSKRWSDRAHELMLQLGPDRFHQLLLQALPEVGKPGKVEMKNHGGFVHPSDPTEIHERSANTLRGLIWTTLVCDDPEVIRAVGQTAVRCFEKIPDVGPRAPKIGNACLVALAGMRTVEAVSQISRIKAKAKHASSQKQIERALQSAANDAGLTPEELEEIAVPTFDLEQVGLMSKRIGDFVVDVTIDVHRKATIVWRDENGKSQKSVPAAVRRDAPEKWKELKSDVKEIESLLPALRARLQRLFIEDRAWKFEDFLKRYINHPLVAVAARRLIWNFENGGIRQAATWHGNGFVTHNDQPVANLNDATVVSLWHPIDSSPDEVLEWRRWLEENHITQPFKQAHREVYVLTDAERKTKTHSHRFASHIVLQHQFQSLCSQRSWRYRLQGEFDSFNEATVQLPNTDINAIFSAEPLEGAVSAHGIFLYLTTGSVRFVRDESPFPIPLDQISPKHFSEVMRDVDLFVGVCSVANDPNWVDHNPSLVDGSDWLRSAFGELSATAETRREVLTHVVPRLKIADQCRFEGRYLVVKGSQREYKIHLGSSNVLMSPNDQYLCIVPKTGAAVKKADRVYLPFEGDQTLALILSKAFLLADDATIKDPTILHQIESL